MRQPSDVKPLYAWWRAALLAQARGESLPSVIEDEPQCGFYKVRMRRGESYQPAAIWLEQVVENGELVDDERFAASVAGDRIAVERIWPYCATRPIRHEDYRQALAQGHFPGAETAKVTVGAPKRDVTKEEPIW